MRSVLTFGLLHIHISPFRWAKNTSTVSLAGVCVCVCVDRRKTPFNKGCPGNDTKLRTVGRFKFSSF